jgi:protein-S-isoprenylcysteine O-methyltransferase Ste14
MGLAVAALRNALLGAIALAICIFGPAGTLDYWQGWVFIAVFTAATTAIGLHLAIRDPALLERRKRFGPAAETRPAQKVIISVAIAGAVALPVFAALDHRFGWSRVSPAAALAGDALVIAGFAIQLLVFRENTYGSSTIGIAAGQTVIATGPYAIVRHPMYAGVLVMMAGVPLALGSWWGLGLLAIQVPVLVWRILDEEVLLTRDLPGYADYKARVPNRLLPYVW